MNNKKILTLIVLLIISVLALIGVFVWQQSLLRKEKALDQQQRDALQSQLNQAIADKEVLQKKIDDLTKKPERYVKVISPNGGENLCLGEDYLVKWESDGVDAVSLTIMQYYIGGGGHGRGLGQFPADQAGENPGEGQYVWKVGTTTSSEIMGEGYGYKIGIRGGYQNNTVEDESDNTFNIVNCK